MRKLVIIMIFLGCFHQSLLYAATLQGKVVSVQGSLFTGTEKLKPGDTVKEGALLKADSKSHAKVNFPERFTIDLLPGSEIRLNQLKKDDTSGVEVIKGQVRFNVEKKSLQAENSDLSLESIMDLKLIINTKSSAVGVKGTELLVGFNPENFNTFVLTFSGEVVMLPKRPSLGEQLNESELDLIRKQLASKAAVVVESGSVGVSNPSLDKQTLPTKISPVQFAALNKSTSGSAVSEKASVPELLPVAAPPVLAGVSVRALESHEEKAKAGDDLAKGLGIGLDSKDVEVKKDEKPEGLVSKDQYKPPAGGYISLPTALYVPPPPGSAYDGNADVFIPSLTVGSVDQITGEYIPPAGFELNPVEGLVKVDEAQGETQSPSGEAQTPEHYAAPNDTAPVGDEVLMPETLERQPASEGTLDFDLMSDDLTDIDVCVRCIDINASGNSDQTTLNFTITSD